jgi:hypothetical protein
MSPDASAALATLIATTTLFVALVIGLLVQVYVLKAHVWQLSKELAEERAKRSRCLIIPKTTAQVMDEDS